MNKKLNDFYLQTQKTKKKRIECKEGQIFTPNKKQLTHASTGFSLYFSFHFSVNYMLKMYKVTNCIKIAVNMSLFLLVLPIKQHSLFHLSVQFMLDALERLYLSKMVQ